MSGSSRGGGERFWVEVEQGEAGEEIELRIRHFGRLDRMEPPMPNPNVDCCWFVPLRKERPKRRSCKPSWEETGRKAYTWNGRPRA